MLPSFLRNILFNNHDEQIAQTALHVAGSLRNDLVQQAIAIRREWLHSLIADPASFEEITLERRARLSQINCALESICKLVPSINDHIDIDNFERKTYREANHHIPREFQLRTPFVPAEMDNILHLMTEPLPTPTEHPNPGLFPQTSYEESPGADSELSKLPSDWHGKPPKPLL